MGGSAGQDMGVQLFARMIRSASKKLRNSDATRRSCRKSRWNSGCGRTFHAMVSVMAVKIQFNSPSGVFLLFSCPGILSMRSMEIPSPRRMDLWQNHRSAILIGVVRHELNTSAGSSADCGRSSSAPHAASRIVSCPPAPRGMMPPSVPPSAPPPARDRSIPSRPSSSSSPSPTPPVRSPRVGPGAGGTERAQVTVLRQLQERVHHDPGSRAVEDVNRGLAHPRLQVVNRQRYVLRVRLVKHPNLPVHRRPRHAVAVVVQQHALVLRVTPAARAQLLDVFHRGIELEPVLGPGLPPLVLRLESLPDAIQSLLGLHGERVDPALHPGARRYLEDVRRVDADVEAEDERDGRRLHPVPHPPLGHHLLAPARGFRADVALLVPLLAEEHGVERELRLRRHEPRPAPAGRPVHAVLPRPRQLHRRRVVPVLIAGAVPRRARQVERVQALDGEVPAGVLLASGRVRRRVLDLTAGRPPLRRRRQRGGAVHLE